MTSQVVSKKRIADHGEVFTAEREVNAMLDLVKHETERIESRFLEPACGTGNFLVPILEKKLNLIKKKYAKSQLEFERHAIIAIGSLYGVDILEDNVQTCRERLGAIFQEMYKALYKKKCKEACLETVKFVLHKNIIWGDALSLKTVGKNQTEIIFSEWAPAMGSLIKRRDYAFSEIIPKDKQKQNGFFAENNVSDLGTTSFIPKTIKEFPLTHFLKLANEKSNQL
ncbi:MAG: DNA methyltransferase [Candidatus Moraniibacteriota bacterium]